jgi:hypothetical protein
MLDRLRYAALTALMVALPLASTYAQEPLSEMCNRCGKQIYDQRAVSYGYRRGFFLNAHGLPTYRAYADMKAQSDQDFYRIGKRSYFHVGDTYFRVVDIYRRNDRHGEKGHLTYEELLKKPKRVHISNPDPK